MELLQDVAFPMLTVVVLSPVAIFCFRNGVPIEIIVFSLLCAGYKGPRLVRRSPGPAPESSTGSETPGSSESVSDESVLDSDTTPNSGETKPLVSWRPWRASHRADSERSGGAWRNTEAKHKNANARPAAKVEAARPKSGLAMLKKNTPQTRWRSIINKFTPEKFEKLYEQLIDTLPTPLADSNSKPAESDAAAAGDGEKTTCCDAEFGKVLEELLSLIFDACSRQHQYTEMYTDLCSKILQSVEKQRPNLDGRSCVWERCQNIFQNIVLKPAEIPADLPEDEFMDRKAKHKEKMVGMVKFGGDLVGRGLVPPEGVMTWIHTLLNEKTEECFSEEQDAQDKDIEKREVQLEVLCAILASMGSSLSDRNTWSEENRLVIEDVFEQLEQLSVDAERLSVRIRCLIRDVLDLRMAQWKEKAGKLKPTTLKERKGEDDNVDTNLRSEAPEFVPGSKGGSLWSSDRLLEAKPWMDPQLLAALQLVEHHLEVIEGKDAKLARLKALIQLYNLIQEKQIVIVANLGSTRRIADMIAESFPGIELRCVEQTTPEQQRLQSLRSFQVGLAAILVMSTDVSARRDFDFGKPAVVLVNFDFPLTLQLYLFRIQKRADRSTHVYTFFSPHDVRHATPLTIVLEGARQKVPPALLKMKEQQAKDDAKSKKDSGGSGGNNRRAPKSNEARADEEENRSSARQRHDDRDGKRWEGGREKRSDEADSGGAEGSRSKNRNAGTNSRGDDGPDGRDGTSTGSRNDRWSELDGGLHRSSTGGSTASSTPNNSRQRRPETGSDGRSRGTGRESDPDRTSRAGGERSFPSPVKADVRILQRGDGNRDGQSQRAKAGR
mmetsp:Transcript_16377/g.28761  ORF Transcript_16377/g.28761 Transcript_16377/m.28761 type:complete len:836 (+) Transcript_16377:38-2545(+)|eukprot:CAMPEP_0197639634 /NCGR_PEP_ID=MMETSP1338-20131121/14198_1 /TAXON_ID=43686 ORGANISM="Pelagodinium beii, Strain RCC1491" /NCGR_SAMPLE_ID=MMETSP1338 /ASSEMBLY_ACC=CAM_ASM_000754 /LENGTH=835 /DNA_ID=CAMNT_0043212389 /DNA_START=38 /DNA_END=2545 /DNA_ORIENTATION=-